MQKPSNKILGFIAKIGLGLVLFLISALLIATLPYALFTNIYDFPERKPFSGKTWHNPYQNLDISDSTVWKKSNFHGHTKAWGQLTDGHTEHEAFDSVYRALGYHSVGISNYQFIDTTFKNKPGHVPCYEHGYNVWKRHHVCIGANSITWLDFMFGQSIHHKQTMLDRIKPTVDVLAIAHPTFRGSFDADDFKYLSNYDCIEVLNHYRISDIQWDSALSAGYPAWIVGDDDTHNAKADGETGVCWTMIHAPGKADRNELIQSLKDGKAFGVTGKRGEVEYYPMIYKIEQDTALFITLSDTANAIDVIGQGGTLMRRDSNVISLRHILNNTDTYIRVKIHGDSSIIWMNPIMRGNGKNVTNPTINSVQTFAYRGAWFAGYFLIGFFIIRLRKRIH
ncbi:MAG: hypothetical protein ACKOX1_08195 [Ignavibacteria bacterium]